MAPMSSNASVMRAGQPMPGLLAGGSMRGVAVESDMVVRFSHILSPACADFRSQDLPMFIGKNQNGIFCVPRQVGTPFAERTARGASAR